MDKTILHCDANNFYASVECAKNPALKGYPIAVCGSPETRHGIVLAKSSEAKKCGVLTGETIWQAKSKCKDLIIVPPDYSAYVRYSNALFSLYANYTDRVESFGLDECWLDVTNSKLLFGSGTEIADKIREDVKRQLSISVSVGVSFCKIFAKLGSDLKKPDAISIIDQSNFRQVAWELPVNSLMMVGKKTAAVLNGYGIKTIGDLAHANPNFLNERLGINGTKLYHYANGEDGEEVIFSQHKSIPESVGNGSTASRDMVDLQEVKTLIIALSELVATRLRQYSLRANGVHISVKNNNFLVTSKQTKTPPINSAGDIIEHSFALLQQVWREKQDLPLRAVTVTAINLISDDKAFQQSMFEDSQKIEKLENSIDKIRSKYGYDIIKRGALMLNTFVTDKIIDDKEFKPFKKN